VSRESFAKILVELVEMSKKSNTDRVQDEPKDEDINIEEIVRIIAPEGVGISKKQEIPKPDVPRTSEKKEVANQPGTNKSERKFEPNPRMPNTAEGTDPPKVDPPKLPQTDKAVIEKKEESLERFSDKVDEAYANLDALSKSIAQLNEDIEKRTKSIVNEMDKLATNLKDASLLIEQAKDNLQANLPGFQVTTRPEHEPSYGAPPRQQQPPPQQSYQPPQQSYQQYPPQQNYPAPQYGYQQPPPQQGYYPPPPAQQGFFQQPPPTPPPPGVSPEEAVTRGTESLRGTVFDDVVSALNQVASIVFSRLLDAREKILRIDPSFPVQEMDPTLSELRANPRMKLSQVDKRKIVERLLNWASRLPRPP
jgi:hypothetical protein